MIFRFASENGETHFVKKVSRQDGLPMTASDATTVEHATVEVSDGRAWTEADVVASIEMHGYKVRPLEHKDAMTIIMAPLADEASEEEEKVEGQ